MSDLLGTSLEREFSKDGAVIARVVESLFDQRVGEGDGTAEFLLTDFGFNPREMERYLRPELTDVLKTIGLHPEVTARVLNEALPGAILSTIGLRENGGNQVREMFNEARKLLHEEGRELVLVFEDLAQFGAFDGELWDQFQTRAKATGLARIRALFAITDGKFETMWDSVKSRLERHYRMDKVDVFDPSSGDLVELLASRYLNLARLGKKRLKATYEATPPEDRLGTEWVPNNCEDFNGEGEPCPHRTACFDGFGEVDGVGLFPYNPVSFRKRLERLEQDPDNLPTPRTVVKLGLARFLGEAHPELTAKSFPSEGLTERNFSHRPRLSPRDLVKDLEGSNKAIERAARVRKIWADEFVENSIIRNWFDLLDPSQDRGVDPGPLGQEFGHDKTETNSTPTRRPSENTDHSALLAWIGDEEALLPERMVRDLRKQLHEDVLEASRLQDRLIDVDKKVASEFVDKSFNQFSFRFKDGDFGQQPGRRLTFNLWAESSGPVANRYEVLAGAIWFGLHGHWDADSDDKEFQMSQETLNQCRTQYELFVTKCGREVREAINSRLIAEEEPVVASVRLRALAMMASGLVKPDSSASEILEKALGTARVNAAFSVGSWQSSIERMRFFPVDRLGRGLCQSSGLEGCELLT